MVVQNITFVLHLSSRYIYGGFSLVGCSPCILMCEFPIVVFIYFSIFLFINPSVRPGKLLRKPSLIALRRLVAVGLKRVAWRYYASSG